MKKVSWSPWPGLYSFLLKNTTHTKRDRGNYRDGYLPDAKYRKLNRIKAD